MLDTAFYLVTRDIAVRSGVVNERYRTSDGRFVLDNKDLGRIRLTSEEFVTGLKGIESVDRATAYALIQQNGNKRGLTEAEYTAPVQESEPVVETPAETPTEGETPTTGEPTEGASTEETTTGEEQTEGTPTEGEATEGETSEETPTDGEPADGETTDNEQSNEGKEE